MFKALMTVQWKWSRVIVLLAAIFGFAIPVLSVQSSSPSYFDYGFNGNPRVDGRMLVTSMESYGTAYAALAAGLGLALAILAWSADHRGRHVYALSLPTTRTRYAAMRFGAGVVFLLVPAVSVLLGSLVALWLTQLPAGLHAYPLSLTLRFFLASLVAFSLFFAISSATAKSAGIVLGAIAVFVVLAAVMASATNFDLAGRVATFLFFEPGILAVFTGRWSLIDV